ncbi:hypothetical protein BLAT2472_40188 [Burkholderia latens]
MLGFEGGSPLVDARRDVGHPCPSNRPAIDAASAGHRLTKWSGHHRQEALPMMRGPAPPRAPIAPEYRDPETGAT